MTDDVYYFSVRLYPTCITYYRWREDGALMMVVNDRAFGQPLEARVDGGDPGDEA